MKNILICTSSFDLTNIKHVKFSNKIKINLNPYGRKLQENELIGLLNKDTIGILSGTEKITLKALDVAKDLQVISRCGTGTDNIHPSVFKKKIKIFKTDKEPVGAVAEFVLTQILMLLKNSHLHNLFMHKKKWKKVKGEMLCNKTFGIIGFGKIGKKIKKLLKPFNCKFLIYDPEIKKFKKKDQLNKLLKSSDIISLNIPFYSSNKNFINFKRLNMMKDNSIFINCSRGGLVDEKSIIKIIKKKPSIRFILDCFDQEPYFGKLNKFDNIILSPHVASFTKETRNLMERNSFLKLIENLKI